MLPDFTQLLFSGVLRRIQITVFILQKIILTVAVDLVLCIVLQVNRLKSSTQHLFSGLRHRIQITMFIVQVLHRLPSRHCRQFKSDNSPLALCLLAVVDEPTADTNNIGAKK